MTGARVTDVAVVGGGVFGCSAALHLKLRGCESVTVIERDRIGAGTSSAGAGLLARWSAGFVPAWGDEELKLETYGLDFYRELSASGYELGYLEGGMLFLGLARPTGRRSLVPLADHDGGEGLTPLTPSEVEALTEGFVQATGIAGGVFEARGARVTAPEAARALAGHCAELGGVILEHAPVSSVRCGRAGGFVLETVTGSVICQKLVVAGGGWTNGILRQLGIWLPVVPLVATRLSTAPLLVPPNLPAIQFCDGRRIYIRADDDSLTWGCNYEGDPRYEFVARELPEHLDGLSLACVAEMERAAQEVARAVPGLTTSKIVGAAHGAPCFTPDLRPVIGELPSVPGLYVLAGDNYAGVTHAPGAGRLLAELVTGAPSPSVDPRPYRPERFGSEYRDGAEVVAAMRWTATRTVLAARSGAS